MKKILAVLTILIVGTLCYYFMLPKVAQNRIKKVALHKLGVLDAAWSMHTEHLDTEYVTTFNSQTLFVDGIYTSMQGPSSYKKFVLDEKEDELYWITKFRGSAKTSFVSEGVSHDFICHMNLYHSDVAHFARLGLNDRIKTQQESQLITLTKGILSVDFPKGFGYPIYSNEKILVGSQALNLNDKESKFKVNYDFKMHYNKDKDTRLKPLYMRYLVLGMPYKDESESKQKTVNTNKDKFFVTCAGPSDNRRFKAENEKGEKFTAFWKVPKGEYTYVNDATSLLNLNEEKTIHLINAHVHPFATSLELKDKTTNTTVFKSEVTNYKNRIGIDKITSFSSEKGIKVYPNHQYELILKVNNTIEKDVDMMASMFIYYYDKELDLKLKKA